MIGWKYFLNKNYTVSGSENWIKPDYIVSQNIPQKGRIKYTDYKDDLYVIQPKNCFAAIVTELVS